MGIQLCCASNVTRLQEQDSHCCTALFLMRLTESNKNINKNYTITEPQGLLQNDERICAQFF